MTSKKIREWGFRQGFHDSLGNCCRCEKPVKARRGWWRRTSYDYDQWNCWCNKCVKATVREELQVARENEEWAEKHMPSIEVLKTFVQPNNPNPERYGD